MTTRIGFILLVGLALANAGSSARMTRRQRPMTAHAVRAPLGFTPVANGFEARTIGGSVRLSDRGLTLRPRGSAHGVRLSFGRPSLSLRSERRLPGVTHQFLGSDPAALRQNMPTYAAVRAELSTGTEVVYYGTDGQLEYDLEVAPQVDPRQVRLTVEGASAVHHDGRGGLRLGRDADSVTMRAPVAYQEVYGRRRTVAASYRITHPWAAGKAEIAFALGEYDHSRRLVIDPVLAYSSFHGGSGADRGTSVAVDAFDNIVVAGFTNSANFPVQSPHQGALGGGEDAFVTKFDPTGRTMLFSTYFGGAGNDRANSIAIDPDGKIAIAGSTTSANLPLALATRGTLGGGTDAFVALFSTTGDVLEFSTYWGGSAADQANGVLAPIPGAVFFTGGTSSVNFPLFSAPQSVKGAGEDAFLAVLPTDGSAPLFSTFLGGNGNERGNALVFGQNSPVTIIGTTTSTDFPLANALQTALRGTQDAFVAQYKQFAPPTFSSYFGGSGVDEGLSGLAFQTVVLVAGATTSLDLPVVNAFQPTPGGAVDGFYSIFDTVDHLVKLGGYIGGSGDDRIQAVTQELSSGLVFGGNTTSTNFPNDAFVQAGLGGGKDGFLIRLAQDSQREGSTYLGGAAEDSVDALASNLEGHLIAVGRTASVAFPRVTPRQNAFAGGGFDGFVSRVQPLGPNAPSPVFTAPLQRGAITVSWADNSSDEIGFLVQVRRPGAGFVEGRRTESNVTSTSVSGLPDLTPIEVRVFAANVAEGLSAPSNIATVTTLPAPPLPPSDCQATALESTIVRLSWVDHSTNETAFRLERRIGTTGNFAALRIVPADTTTFDLIQQPAEATISYRIRSSNAGGISDPTNAATVTAMNPPVLASAVIVSANSVKLTWEDRTAFEAGYRIERKLLGALVTAFAEIGSVPQNATTFTDASAVAGKSYSYRVRAANSTGFSSYSVTKNIEYTVPLAPSQLVGTKTSIFVGQLTWTDRSNNETGFEVHRRVNTGADTVLGITAANQTLAQVPLSPNAQNFFKIRAKNLVGFSAFSNEVNINLVIPKAPLDLTARPISAREIRLEWTDNSLFEDRFVIERSDGGGFAAIGSVPTDATTFIDETASGTGVHQYRVKAVNENGPSPYSNVASARLPRGLLIVPRQLGFVARRGHSARKFLEIRNGSDSTELFVAVQPPTGPFEIKNELHEILLPPLGRKRLTLVFKPQRRGLARGILPLRSSDPSHPKAAVILRGLAPLLNATFHGGPKLNALCVWRFTSYCRSALRARSWLRSAPMETGETRQKLQRTIKTRGVRWFRSPYSPTFALGSSAEAEGGGAAEVVRGW